MNVQIIENISRNFQSFSLLKQLYIRFLHSENKIKIRNCYDIWIYWTDLQTIAQHQHAYLNRYLVALVLQQCHKKYYLFKINKWGYFGIQGWTSTDLFFHKLFIVVCWVLRDWNVFLGKYIDSKYRCAKF